MRLWSIHPSYLDPRGLVALWRESLLAQQVLLGNTKGYRHHPQLRRFRASADPVAAIAGYLRAVADEADCRGYRFDRSKIGPAKTSAKMAVTSGQLQFEWRHLLSKLQKRNPDFFCRAQKVRSVRIHPMFFSVRGGVEPWESGR